MHVLRAGSEDELLARDRLRVDADDHAGRDAVHDVWVAALADADNVAVLESNVGLQRGEKWRQLEKCRGEASTGERKEKRTL